MIEMHGPKPWFRVLPAKAGVFLLIGVFGFFIDSDYRDCSLAFVQGQINSFFAVESKTEKHWCLFETDRTVEIFS
jgi:hypothetical protein